MKRKLLTLIIVCMLAMSCVYGCGKHKETTQEVKVTDESVSESFAKEYFTVIAEWGYSPSYKIVYANDTKVKYFIVYDGYKCGITPLYNTDGSVQVYNGE